MRFLTIAASFVVLFAAISGVSAEPNLGDGNSNTEAGATATTISSGPHQTDAFTFVDGVDLPGFPTYAEIPDVNPNWTQYFLNDVTLDDKERAIDDDTGVIYTCKDQSSKKWALSFNDGTNQYSYTVLKKLEDRNLKGTFFVIGSQSMRNSAATLKAYLDGHEIGMHSWSHTDMRTLTNDEVIAELVYNAKVIYEIIGKVPRYFRTPYNEMDTRLMAIFKALDIVVISGNKDSQDYKLNNNKLTPAMFRENVSAWITGANVPHGIISIQHDGYDLTSKNSDVVMDLVGQSQHESTYVSECICTDTYGEPYATRGKFYELVAGIITIDPPTPPSKKCKYTKAAINAHYDL